MGAIYYKWTLYIIVLKGMQRACPAEEGQDSIPALDQHQKLVSYVDDIMPFFTEEEDSRPPIPKKHSHAHWQSMEKQDKE